MGVNSSAQAVISNCLHEMEKRADGAISIQKDMENLLKVIGEAIPDDGGAEEENDDNSVDQYSYDYGEEFDRPTLNNVTSTMNDTKSVAIRDLSIFGAEGQLLYQDIVDGDLTEHDDILHTIFQQAKLAARLHLIQIKQRLISERDIALQTNEHHNLRLLRTKDDEIAALKEQLNSTEIVRDRWTHKYETLKEKIPPRVTRNQMYYLAEFSVLKIFRNWKQLIADQKKEGQLEKFAVMMKRRSTLSQTFARINRENARSRMEKLKEGHKVLIDRVTREVSLCSDIYPSICSGVIYFVKGGRNNYVRLSLRVCICHCIIGDSNSPPIMSATYLDNFTSIIAAYHDQYITSDMKIVMITIFAVIINISIISTITDR